MTLPVRRFDAIVVGAGGSGMRAALELAQDHLQEPDRDQFPLGDLGDLHRLWPLMLRERVNRRVRETRVALDLLDIAGTTRKSGLLKQP